MVRFVEENIDIFDKLRRFRVSLLLLGVFLLAFSMRYMTHHELLFDPDSYWWYLLAQYYSGINTEHFVEKGGKIFYELAYYPTGRSLEGELLLLPWVIGISFKFLSMVGIADSNSEALLKYMFFIGPFFGALTAVMAYFMGRELTGNRMAGLIAALFYSFAGFAMTRNTAGDTGQESLGTLVIFIFIYFFLKAIRQDDIKKLSIYALASGFFIMLASQTWGGTTFYWGLISLSVLSFLGVKILKASDFQDYRNVAISYIIFTLSGVTLTQLLPLNPRSLGEIASASLFVAMAYGTLVLALLAIGYNSEAFRGKIKVDTRIAILGTFIGAFLLVLIINREAIFQIFGHLNQYLTGHETKDLTGDTVAYYRSIGLAEFRDIFKALVLVIPAGFLYIIYWLYNEKKLNFNIVFLIIFMVAAILANRFMIRLAFLLAFILPLYLGLLIGKYMDTRIVTKKKDDSSLSPGIRKLLAFCLLMFFVVSPMTEGIVQVSAMRMADLGVTPWEDAGLWLKENSPENALLFHWWDYGYYLQTFAERRTMVDGGNIGEPLTEHGNRNVDVANIFTSHEAEFAGFIAPYNPENLPIYVLVSYDEFGKSGAINYHAKDNLYFVDVNYPSVGDIQKDNEFIGNLLEGVGPVGLLNLTKNEKSHVATVVVSIPIDQQNAYQIAMDVAADITTNESFDMERLQNDVNRLGVASFILSPIPDGQGGTSSYRGWVQVGLPEWKDKVLPMLMPVLPTGNGAESVHFEQVYDNGFVYVYKYNP